MTDDDMTVELIRPDHSQWRTLAAEFEDYTYRHLWEFGSACAARQGFENEFIALTRSGRVIGLAHVRVKRAPLLPVGVAYISGGPMIRGRGDPLGGLEAILRALKEVYVTRQKLVLRIQPPFADSDWNERQRSVYLEHGFYDLNRGYQTILVDLEPSEEEIRRRLDQRWRNRLNRSLRSEIRVVCGRDNAAFREFCRLYEILLERKKFEVDLPADFYYRVHQTLDESERFEVLTAVMNDEPIAGYVYSVLGDRCVLLLGATTQAGLKHSASNLLQWHLIRLLKDRGIRWYDLGGIDPQGNPGVYEFKKGLSGTEVTVPGPFECSPGKWQRQVVRLAEAHYRRRKKSASAASSR